jgi:S-(hydroxymethyl)glutathione dehydrogenase/alcohol dehydrogenase
MLDPTMKAAVLNDYAQPLSLEEIRLDAPGPGEVQVRIGATGVCHSDYHVIKGEWKYGLPMILGHEAAGVVEAVGSGVNDLKSGDHAVLSFRPACGTCRLCAAGRSVLCEGWPGDRFKMHDGTARVHRDGQDLLVLGRVGSFAEQVVIPAEQVIPVRNDVPMEVLALIGCAVTTGVGAVINAAKVEPGSTVAVIGCGGVGLNVIQGAALVNAQRIIAVDLLENKLEYARQFGATDVVNAAKGDPVEQVRALTGGGVDYAFEVIGNGTTVEQAIQMTRAAGTACIVGMAPQGTRSYFDPLVLVSKETRLIGTWYGSARPRIDFPRMIEFFASGKLKVSELISRRYSLDQINEGFERLGRGEVARGVIVF